MCFAPNWHYDKQKALTFKGEGIWYVHRFGYVHVGAPPDSYPHHCKGTNYKGNKA